MNILPQLSLNGHYQTQKSMSMVDANGIRLSKDCNTLETDNLIEDVSDIIYTISHTNPRVKYPGETLNREIIYILPCNTELIIFVKYDYVKGEYHDYYYYVFRYKEKTDNTELIIKNYNYRGGKLTGTFTYNVDNDLIIAISEYGENLHIPLKVINIDKIVNQTIDESKVSICPEVRIPTINNINYVKGNAYKGWYYFFIRYKIDNTDYTQWYNFGQPIYVDTINNNSIIKYCYPKKVVNKIPTNIKKIYINKIINLCKQYPDCFIHHQTGGTNGVSPVHIYPDYNELNTLFNNYINAHNTITKEQFIANLKGYFATLIDTTLSEEFPIEFDTALSNIVDEFISAYFGSSSINLDTVVDINKGLCSGCSDYFSNESDISSETIKFDINIKESKYKYYQIGFIVANKTYNKGFISNDININNKSFTINISNYIEYEINNLILDYYNYYNIHKVINYNNRLYIGNYEEDNINNNELENITKNITVDIVSENFPVEGYSHYDTAIVGIDNSNTNTANQYDFENKDNNIRCLPLAKYFNVIDDTDVTIIFGPDNNLTVKECEIKDCYFVTNDSNNNNIGYAIINYTTVTGDNGYTGTDYIVIVKDDKYIENSALDYKTFRFTNIVLIESKLYNNPTYSFNSRKLSCTLIPNEIYSFYIHFVDKYGHATNGYKLQNDKNIYNRIINSDPDNINEKEIETVDDFIAYPIIFRHNNNVYVKYAICYLNKEINDINFIEIGDKKIDSNGNVYFNIFPDLNTAIAKDKFINTYKAFNNTANTWEQILYYNIEGESNDGTYKFIPYKNNNNDILFKVPAVKNEVWQVLNIYPKFSNIIIPNGYVGYYISCEKFESCRRTTGMLTRSDFRSQDKIDNIDLESSNTKKSSKMYYYTDDYDIDDSIKLDYNMMIIDGTNVWDYNDIMNKPMLQSPAHYTYPHDINKANINSFGGELTVKYPISNYKLVVANSSIDNRVGLGTALELDDVYNLFKDNPHVDEWENSINDIYRCSFYNYSRNIYTKTDKELIRIGDIQYNNNNYTITTGLNGHYTFSGFLVYNNDTVILDTATNDIKRIDNNTKYKNVTQIINENDFIGYYKANIPFAAYVQLLICDTKFHESKHFNNEPKGIVYQVKKATDNDTAKFARGCFVEPINTIDLFKNRQTSSDEFYPKISTNYKPELANKIHYTKTIRRSNVIQDESKSIAWRRFPIEAYKNISENKGAITNIIGTGTSLLVHTEHSLFLFDVNNLLSTVDNTIQLTQPDSFEVAYKEIFSSILGYGGLKDEDAYIVGEYGYIWFDSNNLFQYDYKSTNRGRTEPALALLDTDIKEYINRNDITNVRFGEDKANNRLLITLKVNNQFKCLSYNCMSKSFISFHTYDANEYRMYNTKNNIYFAINRTENVKTFNTTKFGDLNKVNINIIVTDSYNTIKYLNAIKYRFTEETQVANSNSPVEEMSLIPFSGLTIRAFSNETDTNELNVQIPYTPYGTGHNTFMNYTKPYYDRGNWNFNYLFNKREQSNTRIYGNYLMIDFKLKDKNDTNTNNIMIEDVNFNISAI